MKPNQIIKILVKRDFKFIRQKGSHKLYKRGGLRVTVPYHTRDLKPGTLQNILKQAGIRKEDLKNF